MLSRLSARTLAKLQRRIPSTSRTGSTVPWGGPTTWMRKYCCANFALLDSWLEARGHQQRGFIAGAPTRLVAARDVVVAALDHLRENEVIFLHPHGVCSECDAAR